MSRYRYGACDDGPDPLAPPYDVRDALDEIGDAVLDGLVARARRCATCCAAACPATGGGAASTTCCARSGSAAASCATAAGSTARSRRPARCSTRRSGRSAPRCSPTRATTRGCARPSSTRCRPTPRGRSGGSPTTTGARRRPGRRTSEIKDLLRREVLDAQFRGMKQALENPDPAGDAAGQGHDGRAQRRCSTRTRAASTPRRSSTEFMAGVRRLLPRQPAEPRGAGRLARPPRRGGRTADAPR